MLGINFFCYVVLGFLSRAEISARVPDQTAKAFDCVRTAFLILLIFTTFKTNEKYRSVWIKLIHISCYLIFFGSSPPNTSADPFQIFVPVVLIYLCFFHDYKTEKKACIENSDSVRSVFPVAEVNPVLSRRVPETPARQTLEDLSGFITDSEDPDSEWENPSGFITDSEDSDSEKNRCEICMDKKKNIVFQCGHFSCESCSNNMDECHLCRKYIRHRIKCFL